jgi:hypothetical protein
VQSRSENALIVVDAGLIEFGYKERKELFDGQERGGFAGKQAAQIYIRASKGA